MSTDASSFDMPRPDRVNTPAEFIAAMRALRAWAKLTYRQIEDRARQAGDKLPHSTIATALSRNRIPRDSTIASFVRACGGDRHTVDAWLAARKRISAEDETDGNLAYAVEAWLISRSKLSTQEIRTLSTEEIQTHSQNAELTSSYSAGTLARAVAETKGEKWVGLHRRRREPARFRRLIRRVREH